MATEQETLSPPTVEPVPEQLIPPQEEPVSDDQVTEEGQDQELPEVEMVDIEIDGKVYTVPKEIEAGILRNEDYTQKSQETAKERERLEAEQTALIERSKVQGALIDDYTEIKGMEAGLKQFENVDWPTYAAENPKEANIDWMRYQQLQQLHGRKANELAAKVQHFRNTSEQQRADIERATVEALRKPDPKTGWPGYSPELMSKLSNYGREIGMTNEQLSRIVDPLGIKILYGQYSYVEGIKKAAAASQKPRVDIQPVAKIASSRAKQVSPSGDELSTDQWLAQERKREAQKRQAVRR